MNDIKFITNESYSTEKVITDDIDFKIVRRDGVNNSYYLITYVNYGFTLWISSYDPLMQNFGKLNKLDFYFDCLSSTVKNCDPIRLHNLFNLVLSHGREVGQNELRRDLHRLLEIK